MLINVLRELIPENEIEEYQQASTDMDTWLTAFKEAVNLVEEPTPESGFVDDFGHSRKLIHFLDQHKGCSEKVVFELMWGW